MLPLLFDFAFQSESLILLLAIMAFLYASVGHGGASGYLAVMAIFSYRVIIEILSKIL